jgi:hypothetical protein
MIAIVAAPLLAVGLLGYTGLWRSWARGGLHYAVLGCAWWGAGLALIGLAGLFPHGIAAGVGLTGCALAVLGVIGFFWLPAPLTPRWFRAERQRRRA